MNQEAQDKLRALRQRLADLEPYPWEPVESWIASAKPLIRACYRDHLDGFLAEAATPHWYAAIRIVPGPYSDVDPRNQGRPRRDAFADAAASEHRENRRIAQAAKDKILAFVDGLLDLPPLPTGHVGEAAPMQIEGLSDDAGRILGWLREQYVKASYPNHKVWTFKAHPEHRAVFAELRAQGYIETLGGGNVEWRLTDFGQQMILQPPEPAGDFTVNIHHHHGGAHMGDRFTTNITGSTLGAFAEGTGAVATGTVTVHQGALTQAQHLEHIKAAKKALADDEERLAAAVYEALETFLKRAREVQVEHREIDDVQAEIEGILDRVWAEHSGKALPQGLGVTQALSQSPAMVGAMKKLLGA